MIKGDGKYVELAGLDGLYWIPSGFATLDPTRFYLPTHFTDPFTKTTELTYDAHTFLVTEVEDPLSNTVLATNDYRVLAPNEVTDPNGNRVEVAFDPLGRVTRVAVKGKTGSTDGDTLTDPTEELTYETTRWTTLQQPNRVKRRARETHGASATAFQESYVYTDGSGRVALTKARAEPDSATPTTPRWVGSGKTVVNNKGNPVKQYEPYFAATHEFETDDDLRTVGVTPLITYDAVGRVARFQNPDLTFRTATFSPWLETASDEIDTQSSGPHIGTPTRTHFDPLGRPFLVQADNGTSSSHVFYNTRSILDIEGLVREVKDPIGTTGRVCQTNTFSMSGRLLKEANIDKGARYNLTDVGGAPIRRWDQRAQVFRFVYDDLRRPTHLWVKIGAAAEILLERRYYGEAASTPTIGNRRGQLILAFDQAGQSKLGPFDFKGNLEESSRKLPNTFGTNIDWSALDAVTNPATAESNAASALEADTYGETREYDALNRVIELTTHDYSRFIPTFNQAGLLDKVDVFLRGAGTSTRFVRNIDYDAHGRRKRIEYGNAVDANPKVVTDYTYDPLTFRLTNLLTTRIVGSKKLQDLTYTYDAVGNITAIADAAHQDVFFNNSFVSAGQTFTYDALYRLVEATGREHMSIGGAIVDHGDVILEDLPHANQGNAVRNYTEEYVYDAVGNILELFHSAAGTPAATWTRTYTYTAANANNRLVSTTGGGACTHDVHGNITSMSHLATIDYDPFDQMSHADLGGGGDAYYTYDASGQRVRKVIQDSVNTIKERIYLGAFEIYRERILSPTPSVQFKRETLHIMDGVQRVAMVETKTREGGFDIGAPVMRTRVQYSNHLGSAHLECDQDGLVISYEEMHPYGSSAYRSAPSASEVTARRYRYTGKERDEETGLDYFGARYYAPWLGRWTTADPLGLQAGLNLYLYGRASPVVFVDPNGMKETPAQPDWVVRMSGPTVAHQSLRDLDETAGAAVAAGAKAGLATAVSRSAKSLAATPAETVAISSAAYGDTQRAIAQARAAEARRAAAAEWAVSGPKVQNEALGAVGGAIVASKLGAVKGVRKASSFLGYLGLAGVAGHDDSRQIAAALSMLLGGLGPSGTPEAAVAKGEVGAATALERRMAQTEQGIVPSRVDPSQEFSLPKSEFYHPEIAAVATGRTAQVRNAMIQDIASKELKGIRFRYLAEYNPFLKPLGIAEPGKGSQIGQIPFAAQDPRKQVAATMVHEEFHHRLWEQGVLGRHHTDPKINALFERVMELMEKAKGWPPNSAR